MIKNVLGIETFDTHRSPCQSIRYEDVYKCELDKCHTLLFFLTYFLSYPS